MAQPDQISDRIRSSYIEDTLASGTSREKVSALIDPSQIPLPVTTGANNLKITNIISPGISNTEFTHSLLAGCKAFLVKARSSSVTLNFAWAATETSTNYLKIRKGVFLYSGDVNFITSKIIYLSCSGTSEIIEILEWI